MKEHPELYDKEHGRFHDRQRKEALWAELKLQPFDVRRWFENSLWQALQATVWPSPKGDDQETVLVYQQMGFLKTHIRCKRASRSYGFEASPNTSRHEESCGSTTDTEHLESSVLRESRSQPMLTSTPLSTFYRFQDTRYILTK